VGVMVTDYKELHVWQKSIELVKQIYEFTGSFPKEELYALTDQIKRSAVSIPANIAEGSGRNTSKEFVHFLYISLGSACELETHLIIAREIGYIQSIEIHQKAINEIQRMLNGLINSIKTKGTR
jgi:four helix bundle protein